MSFEGSKNLFIAKINAHAEDLINPFQIPDAHKTLDMQYKKFKEKIAKGANIKSNCYRLTYFQSKFFFEEGEFDDIMFLIGKDTNEIKGYCDFIQKCMDLKKELKIKPFKNYEYWLSLKSDSDTETEQKQFEKPKFRKAINGNANNILNIVCKYYGVDEGTAISESKNSKLVKIRYVGMFLTKKYFPKMSSMQIANVYNRKDPTTIHQGISKLKTRINKFYDLREDIKQLSKLIERELNVSIN